MTATFPDLRENIVTDAGVYAPQHDSRLLIAAMVRNTVPAGRRVLDLCTGSGVVAIAAAQLGAASVTALDICPRAVRCASANAAGAGVELDSRVGSLREASASGPFDLVVCNPPYVPVGPGAEAELISTDAGPVRALFAGEDGRLVLDPLCAGAADLLRARGTVMLVQSEFAGIPKSLTMLTRSGLHAEIVSRQSIPFGPALSAAANWLERTGRLPFGIRQEKLVVIRADKR